MDPHSAEAVGFADFHGDGAPDEPVGGSPDERVGFWRADNVELTTVGVDVGSSTSHLMFARLHLQRLSQSLSSRFVVVERHVLYRSPILLTPYRQDGLIDADRLGAFVDRAYAEAGVARDAVDTGAVLLTGTALERPNARAVAELFAREGGKFVCASAGHRLEALLAAHGSGAVARSRRTGATVLNVDLGGGTAKLALVEDGEVLATSALAIGARLVAFGPDGAVERVEPAAARLAAGLGLPLELGQPLRAAHRAALVAALADALLVAARGGTPSGPARELMLLEPLPERPRPAVVTFSGGVAEFIYRRTRATYGDLGEALAAELLARRSELPAPLAEPAEGIRATVVGASQYSVQLSGNTIYVSDRAVLPLRNVPVVAARFPPNARPSAEAVATEVARGIARLDLAGADGPVAVALSWRGEPEYSVLRGLAEGILRAHLARATAAPIVVAADGDIGVTLGAILREELRAEPAIVSLDGLELGDLDYVDLGAIVEPTGVVPVVVKSLAFAPDARC